MMCRHSNKPIVVGTLRNWQPIRFSHLWRLSRACKSHHCISTVFELSWEMPIPNDFLAVFGQNDPQNVKTKTKFHSEGTSLRRAAYFELSCVQIGPRVWPGRDSEKLKTKKMKKKSHSTRICHDHRETKPLIRSKRPLAGLEFSVT